MGNEQEMIKNALKELICKEEATVQKYVDSTQKIMKPELQTLLHGMEMAARNNYKSLTEKMNNNKK